MAAPKGNKYREKYDLDEQLKDCPDGEVLLNLRGVKTNDFKKEKDLVNYIVLNINEFCNDILNDELISFEVEYPLTKQMRKGRCQRVDLFVICAGGKYIIEAKKPQYICENRYAIGQLLDYGREYLDSKKEQVTLCLITTFYDLNTAKTIKCYNLPIRYIYFDKKRTLEISSG